MKPHRVLFAALGLLLAGWTQATTFAPPQVIECPGSKELRRVTQLMSGNTFGAEFWTDGYVRAPMLPDLPQITRCADNGPIFWVRDAKVVGELGRGDKAKSDPPAWAQAPAVRPLTLEEFLQAIAQGLGDTPEKLAYLRRQAWWQANHAHRQRPESAGAQAESDFALGSPDRANLEALQAALNTADPGQRLMKVEALRQLARFDEAQALLDQSPFEDDRFSRYLTVVRERLKLRDARVAKLPERQ